MTYLDASEITFFFLHIFNCLIKIIAMDNLVVAGYRLGHVSSDFSHCWTWRCGSLCRCVRLQLQPLAYLWRRDQAELLREIISSGLQALLIKVAAYGGWQAGLEQSSYQWGFTVRNEWCMYIALYCVLLYSQSALQSSGVSPQPPPVCSIHLDDATAATGHGASALTTHQPQVERRES